MTVRNQKKKDEQVTTLISPAGFIEQCYVGDQNEQSVKQGIKELKTCISKLKHQNKPAIILVDLSTLGNTDLGAHKAAILGMRTLDYQLGAFYGPLPIQVLLNTLSLVSGMQKKLKVFETRVEAVKWLKAK